MSNAAGLKHVATEPAQLETKRERRRGTSARAAGRAAALRRAPSDSDCSGETASLSADSGDRSVRPAPPPPRTTKSRSRRRGSEWEVLEGLKDGQRFEKRPEVFNGYLHKKRKWPLKGWHKRFFVVDGGILVYARSPTDVARGRLHGSVDVGLSVISAKARRRRIDIDADEFIYHLRAKTPELFRTWLNVLKTHRLYRQHLLTFGARESVPKIHAPLDELPPTENSSRTTPLKFRILCDPSSLIESSSNCKPNLISSIFKRQFSLRKMLKLGYEHRKVCSTHSKIGPHFVSLCSWGSGNEKPGLDFSNQLTNLKCTFSYEHFINLPLRENKERVKPITMPNSERRLTELLIQLSAANKVVIKENNTPTYFLFSGFKHDDNTNRPIVRKSRKATNVVKYKNKFEEPTLKGPMYNCMILDNCKLKTSKKISSNLKYNTLDIKSKELKGGEKLNTVSRYDALIETIMLSIFNEYTNTKLGKKSSLKSNLKKVLKEIYNMKFNTSFDNSVKELFRCLLEYWLKNTFTKFKDLAMENKSIESQSNSMFMRNIATQVHGICDILDEEISKVNINKIYAPNRESATSISRTNDKPVQDLEEVIKSIIYVCQIMNSDKNKEKDITITQSPIKTLGSSSKKTIFASSEKKCISSDSSFELPQIRNTLNDWPHAARKFLRLYLNLLQSADGETINDFNTSTLQLKCDVETNSIERKVSKSLSTERSAYYTCDDPKQEPRELQLRSALDTITRMFGVESMDDEVLDINSSNLKFSNNSFMEETFTREQSEHSSDLIYSITNANTDSCYDLDLFNTLKLKPYASSREIYDIQSMQNKNPKLQINKKNKKLVKNLQSVNVIQKKLKLNCTLDSKKPESTAVGNCNQTIRFDFIEDVLMFGNLPKIVNERIILLLLSNLSSLSENVPHLHKDINALHRKLHKKYENELKGLSLLGKIYNEDTKFRDNETQYDECQNLMDQSISTDKSTSIDEETNTSSAEPDYSHEGVQYSVEIHNLLVNDKNSRQTFSVSSVEIIREDKTVSVQIWAATSQAPETLSKIIQVEETKELTNVPSSLKISTKTQTATSLRSLRTKTTNKDHNIYQLCLNKPTCLSNGKQKSSKHLNMLYRCSSDSFATGLVSPTSPPLRGPQAGFVSGTPGGRLASWIIESGGPLDSASRELGQAQLSVQQLQRLLDALELQQQAHHDTDVSLEGASPSVKKDRRKFGLRKKKSSNKCSSVELAPPHVDPSGSHTALSALTALTAPPSPGGGASSMPNSAASLPIACAATRPQSLPGAEVLHAPTSLSSLTPDQQLRDDFTVLAKDLVATLKTVVATLVCERGRLRAAMEAAESPAPRGLLASLRTNLSSALHQNSELRSRLARIHDASDLADVSSLGHNSEPSLHPEDASVSGRNNRRFPHSLSYSSSCVSASEFFDAEEHEEDKADEVLDADEAGVIELDGDSTSEAGSLSSEDGSASSDNSDAALAREERAAPLAREGGAAGVGGGGGAPWTRRTRLPHPRPSPAPPSLWNLLYKNIGKDLSQISMPVTINEPLNMLQRLCEELEYSELLDAAAGCESAAERCALVAAFAVSAYAATAHRAASKPFNPLLGETYECVRADRGFSFLAEQVSHHPPVSACHAESPRWLFWQEARIKTKFWGKSMEFQPAGKVHVRLLTTGDHYSWNKVTTCVHNLFGGQRWVDQYGDMIVSCHGTEISCKLNFIKASSWSNSRHEVRGAVVGAGSRLRLQGRWTEALHAGEPPAARCLWRPGAMPADHELYYGFTRFAMELNELEPGMREVLPPTDTRLRPDQRALEHGDVDAAERLKLQLEQAQRERRRTLPHHDPLWFRRAAEEEEEGEETWVFAGEYWRARERGFPELRAPRLW